MNERAKNTLPSRWKSILKRGTAYVKPNKGELTVSKELEV